MFGFTVGSLASDRELGVLRESQSAASYICCCCLQLLLLEAAPLYLCCVAAAADTALTLSGAGHEVFFCAHGGGHATPSQSISDMSKYDKCSLLFTREHPVSRSQASNRVCLGHWEPLADVVVLEQLLSLACFICRFGADVGRSRGCRFW